MMDVVDSHQLSEYLRFKCETLQKAGRYAESIEIMENQLQEYRFLNGESSLEAIECSDRLCEVLNLHAMVQLQKDAHSDAFESLKKAQELCTHSQRLRATTMNNFACFYRRTGKPRSALNYLQSAFEIELKVGSTTSLADTHLNLCAVLSELDRHSQALEHSLLSIVLLQDDLLQQTLRNHRTLETNRQKTPSSKSQPHQPQTDSLTPINKDRLAVLTIALHNLGVELEHLKRHEESLKVYNRALLFAQDNLGKEHELVSNLNRVIRKASNIQFETKGLSSSKGFTQRQQRPASSAPRRPVPSSLDISKERQSFFAINQTPSSSKHQQQQLQNSRNQLSKTTARKDLRSHQIQLFKNNQDQNEIPSDDLEDYKVMPPIFAINNNLTPKESGPRQRDLNIETFSGNNNQEEGTQVGKYTTPMHAAVLQTPQSRPSTTQAATKKVIEFSQQSGTLKRASQHQAKIPTSFNTPNGRQFFPASKQKKGQVEVNAINSLDQKEQTTTMQTSEIPGTSFSFDPEINTSNNTFNSYNVLKQGISSTVQPEKQSYNINIQKLNKPIDFNGQPTFPITSQGFNINRNN